MPSERSRRTLVADARPPPVLYNGPVKAERYLNPDVAKQISRLDLRARCIVEGFLSGLHASPLQGFSVEFSEHRRYEQGDDLKDIDWRVLAKTDRYYIKKYQAETNLTGYLLIDLSESMGFTHRQNMTKFDYVICLAAAMAYMMVQQQDSVGLLTFDTEVRKSLPAKSSRKALANILAMLAQSQPTGPTDVKACLTKFLSMVRNRSLVMIMSDLLTDPEPVVEGLRMLRHAGHDIILFHVLDEAEVTFPFDGMVDLEEPESGDNLVVDARGVKTGYLDALAAFRENLKTECLRMGADFVPLDTSMRFDRALIEYLSSRQARF